MDTQILPSSEAEGHRAPVTSHESPVTWCKLFSFTLLSKNVSANHLESHSCKNKGLKVPCFHTLTKKGVGEGVAHSNIQHLPSNFRSSILAVAPAPQFSHTINPPTAQRQPCNAW